MEINKHTPNYPHNKEHKPVLYPNSRNKAK